MYVEITKHKVHEKVRDKYIQKIDIIMESLVKSDVLVHSLDMRRGISKQAVITHSQTGCNELLVLSLYIHVQYIQSRVHYSSTT